MHHIVVIKITVKLDPASQGSARGRKALTYDPMGVHGGDKCCAPRGVPVPCISRATTSAAEDPAAARAPAMTSCWEGPLGAVRLLDRPSCKEAQCTAQLHITLLRHRVRRLGNHLRDAD